MAIADRIKTFVDDQFVRETEFLAELVKVPSDNPPDRKSTRLNSSHRL